MINEFVTFSNFTIKNISIIKKLIYNIMIIYILIH